jgi:hexosaminidase
VHSSNNLVKITIFAALISSAILPGHATQLNLMPWPSQLEQQSDSLNLHGTLRIESTGGGDERVNHALARFQSQLSLQAGVPFNSPLSDMKAAPVLSIHCESHGLAVQSLTEDESYHLVIDAKHIELTAPNPLGIMHGLKTLLQLVQSGPNGWFIPAVRIDDSPRFPWRGLMIDVSRHFMPIQVLKRNIDGMAAVKLNVLHLHLSDDEGFRVESRRCPKLTQLASGGLFYTQAQMRDLVLYARERGIRVVPEFDVPGHAVSWLAAYPELASAAGPITLVRSHFDKNRPPFDPTQEATYKLLNTVFTEMAALFPDAYFHIGGDEVDGKYWDKNQRIQAWMQAHHIKDNHALQAYFNQRIQVIVTKQKKHMEGWDEILSPNLPKDTLIQSWRGAASLAEAAKMGYPTLLSAGFYLDLMYPASTHYVVDPLSGDSASLTPEQQKRIIGGEAAEWSEYVTEENIDNRIWPRLGAIAERLWSPASVTSLDSMYARLAVLNQNLDWLDLRHRTNSRRMIDRIAGSNPPEPFDVLAMAVEPVKEYNREKTQEYDVDVPLNRLVDAVSPESDGARTINQLTQSALHDPSSRPQLRKWLTKWSNNDAQLEPFLVTSALRAELAPLSQDLSALGTLGLQALDVIESGQSITAEKRAQQLATLEQKTKPHAELQLAVEPTVRLLIEAQPVTP